MVEQMLAAGEFPDHDIAVGRNEAGARGVVGDPQLHVGRIGCVADVERIEAQDAGIVALPELAHQPAKPVLAHRLQIGCLEPCSRPRLEGQRRRADLDAIVIVGRAVRLLPGAGRRTARRVDLAVGTAEGGDGVHGRCLANEPPCPMDGGSGYARPKTPQMPHRVIAGLFASRSRDAAGAIWPGDRQLTARPQGFSRHAWVRSRSVRPIAGHCSRRFRRRRDTA